MSIQDIVASKMLKIANELPNFHSLTPTELEQLTKIDAKEWHQFISNNEQVRQLIHRRTNEDIEIAQRKALQALGKEAGRGNVQAIKELNQISGILNQQNNKQFITHFIPRPQTQAQTQPPTPPKTGEVAQDENV